MASRQQILDMLTCAAIACEPGYSVKRLEQWVKFYCHPDHPDAFKLSEKARGLLQSLFESLPGAEKAMIALDAERAKGIALARLESAGVELAKRGAENRARHSLGSKHAPRTAAGEPSKAIGVAKANKTLREHQAAVAAAFQKIPKHGCWQRQFLESCRNVVENASITKRRPLTARQLYTLSKILHSTTPRSQERQRPWKKASPSATRQHDRGAITPGLAATQSSAQALIDDYLADPSADAEALGS